MKQLLIILFLPLISIGQSQFDEVNMLFETKEYAKAQELAIELVKENPNSLKAIEVLGDAYGYQKNWDKAISNYKILVDKRPDIADYHYKYGGVLGMKALSVSKLKALGMIGDLKKAFLKAAELDSSHIETRWALVELYMQLPAIIGGSKRKSLKYAEELQNLSEVDGYLAKGYIYEYDKEHMRAESYYEKALDVGGSVVCYQSLTDLYIKQGLIQKAIIYLEEAYQKHQTESFKIQLEKLKNSN